MRTVYFTLEDMADCGLKPDLDTFKTLMDGLNAVDKRHAYTMAIYDFWREFTRHFPTVRPDVELLNKLLYSCRKCGQVERALFFLGIIEGCGLNPDLDTFRELLMVRPRGGASGYGEGCGLNSDLDIFRELLMVPVRA